MSKRNGIHGYKQLNITHFFSATSKKTLLNTQMGPKEKPTSKKGLLNTQMGSKEKATSKNGLLNKVVDSNEKFNTRSIHKENTELMYTFPVYVPPKEESMINISSESECDFSASPAKQSKLGDSSSVTCNITTINHNDNNKNLHGSFTLKLKRTSSLDNSPHIIGVFPPTKLDVTCDISKALILQEISQVNQNNLSTFISDENHLLKLANEDTHWQNNLTENRATGQPNWNYLYNFKEIYMFISSHPMLSKLLSAQEMELIDTFLKNMKESYSLFCIRLFLRPPRWYNIFKIRNEFKVNIPNTELKDMFYVLLKAHFIMNDFSSESPTELLKLLTLVDIKNICKKFKLPIVKKNKSALINMLLQNCNEQAVLVPYKNTHLILMERIKEKLGICIKLSSTFRNLLKKIHFLYSFPVSDFKTNSDMYYFLDRIHSKEIKMPKFYVYKNTTIFESLDSFNCYCEAVEYRRTIEEAHQHKQNNYVLELCEIAYSKLLEINNNDQEEMPVHLVRFTPKYAYTELLSFGAQALKKHYPQSVEKFLKLLLESNSYFNHKRGVWYDMLVMVQYRYCKNHEMAAETLIKALHDKTLSEVDQCILDHRAENIKNNKSNKLSKLITDRICFAQPSGRFPSIEIDALEITRGRKIGKKHYRSFDGNMNALTVEDVALNHYLKIGYDNGFHCEGGLLTTLFFTLFWDIIYDDTIPHVFLSELQYLPLDFFTNDFYTNRKDAIEMMLKDLETWSTLQLSLHIKKNWEKHSTKKSLINHNLDLDSDKICDIISCITFEVVIKICRRIFSNTKSIRSGIPDLFVWNKTTKMYKFVEVKSDKDKLSCKQEMWIQWLISNSNAELCHVHSICSKSRACHRRKQ